MKISIVIPALNEEEAIANVIQQVPCKQLEEMGYGVEVIVADNGSTDNTAEIARSQGAVVVFQSLKGYGNAYKAGFATATGDIIVTGDADMTYPFDAVPEILEIMKKKNADFVNTDRLTKLNKEAMLFSHVIGNWGLTTATKVLFLWPFKDSQSGMWIFKRSILPHLDVRSGGMQFSQELKVEAYVRGFKCIEVPIEYRARVGEVKLNAIRDGVRNLTQLFVKRIALWKEAFTRPFGGRKATTE